MEENNERDKPNHLLGNHVWCLGADVWQLGKQKEPIKKQLPNNPKMEKLIQIAQVLDKYQPEITYYQARIRGILQNLENQKKNDQQ